MSETEAILPPINTNIITETGLSIAKVTVNGIKVCSKDKDGIKQVYMHKNNQQINFFLNEEECRHIAELLVS